MKEWQQLEQWVCEKLRPLDPYIHRTPGSGNKGCKGDAKFSINLGLHLEAKWRNLKSVYKQEWLDKCTEEIPLHSAKIPVVITEDKNKNKVAHLKADDFLEMYIKLYKLENNNG